MPENPTLAEILQSDPFHDPNFAPLDLRGYPRLQMALEENAPEPEDDRFAPREIPDPREALRAFVENPDFATLEELAPDNPDIAMEVLDRRAEQVANAFKAKHKSYYPTDANMAAIVAVIAEKNGCGDLDTAEAAAQLQASGAWTLENLEWAFRTLSRSGELEVRPGTLRPLTESQKLHCAQLAAVGRTDDAIGEYVAGRLGPEQADALAEKLTAEEFLSNPKFRPLVTEATLFAWQQSRHDFAPSAERLAYLKDYCGTRFVTLALLDAAWVACKQAEAEERAALRDQPGPPENLEDLSDSAIDSLYAAQRRDYARSTRRR